MMCKHIMDINDLKFCNSVDERVNEETKRVHLLNSLTLAAVIKSKLPMVSRYDSRLDGAKGVC